MASTMSLGLASFAILGRRLRTWFAVIVAAGVLSGCGLVTLAYNRIPTLLYWKLDGMVDLSTPQSAWLRGEIDRWHAWHRRTHLPAYAGALAEWRGLAAADLTPAMVCERFDQVRTWVDDMVIQGMPALARLAQELTPAQMDHLRRHYQKEDETFRQDFMNGNGGVSQKRVSRAIDRAEMFYGTLTSEQRLWVRQRLQQSAFRPEQTLAERQRRQADLLEAIARVQAGTPARAALQDYWSRVKRSPQPAYNAYADAATRDGCAFVAELHNRTTPEQRRQAVQQLLEYEQAFRALALEP
jgi:hypothetical protein